MGRPEFVLKRGKQEAGQEGDPGPSHERASPYIFRHRSPVDCSLNPSLYLDPRIPFFVFFFFLGSVQGPLPPLLEPRSSRTYFVVVSNSAPRAHRRGDQKDCSLLWGNTHNHKTLHMIPALFFFPPALFFFPSFHTYLLSPYFVPGAVLDIAGYSNEQSRQGSCPHGGDILVEKGVR